MTVINIVGYGVWLRHVFKHQIAAKDATIGSFEAALKSKDAEISRLRADTAPAVAAACDAMRKHADQMTVDVNRLNQKLDEQTKVLPQDRLRVETQLLGRIGKRLLDLMAPIPQRDYEAFRRVCLSIY